MGAFWPSDQNLPAVGEQAVEPVGVANRQQGKAGLPGGDKGMSITSRLARLQGAQRGHLGFPGEHRGKTRASASQERLSRVNRSRYP